MKKQIKVTVLGKEHIIPLGMLTLTLADSGKEYIDKFTAFNLQRGYYGYTKKVNPGYGYINVNGAELGVILRNEADKKDSWLCVEKITGVPVGSFAATPEKAFLQGVEIVCNLSKESVYNTIKVYAEGLFNGVRIQPSEMLSYA